MMAYTCIACNEWRAATPPTNYICPECCAQIDERGWLTPEEIFWLQLNLCIGRLAITADNYSRNPVLTASTNDRLPERPQERE